MMKISRLACAAPSEVWLAALVLSLLSSVFVPGTTPSALAQQSDEEIAQTTPSEPETQSQNADRQNTEPQDPNPQNPNQRPKSNHAQPPKRDRVSQLMDSLPPEVLNRLLGADVAIEVIGGQVILKGPEQAVEVLEQLIRALDEGVRQKSIRVVQIKEHDAGEIARTVQEAFRESKATSAKPIEEEVTITAISGNVVIVSALEEEMDEVLSVLEAVDSVPPELGRVEKMSFPIKHRRASEVAAELQEIINKLLTARGQRPEQSKIQIIPNNANNFLTILAPDTERAKLEALIAEIDVEPVKDWGEVKLTVFPLVHSKANDFSGVINNLLTATKQSQQDRQAAEEVIYRLSISKASPSGELTELEPIDLQKTMKIIPDAGTNSLIVATVEENVGPIGELIRLMDGVPVAESLDVKLFPLRFADAEGLRDLIREMFKKGKELPPDPDGSGADAVPAGEVGESLVYDVGIEADARTNTLIVSGRVEQLALVERVITDLDRPATALRFPLRTFSLVHADVTRIGKLITDLFDQRFEAAQASGANQTALERERVFLTTDLRSNTLIVSASDENYAEIVRIARQLDTAPQKIFEQVRVVSCKPLSAQRLKEQIDELWKRKAALRQGEEQPEDNPVVVIDDRSKSLIVASSREDFEEIESLVEALKTRPREDDVQLFKLDHADATVLAGMMDELFKGLAGQVESFESPTIIPDSRSNALVVAASLDAMERVEDLIRRLDVQAGPNTAVFKVYALKYGSSAKISARMQELFDSRREGSEKTTTPIVILSEESSNSLICSASRDDHVVVAELIQLLDRPSSIARYFDIFPLKMANAANAAEKLATVFASQGEGSGKARADAIAVEADDRTNSLIVWASPSEMVNIAEVIDRLDTTSPAREMKVKVIQLRQALASDFADLLNETLLQGDGGGDATEALIISFNELLPDGREVERKLLRQDIKVQPDPRTNSLMVMAPAESMVMLEAMIRDFDRIRPVTSHVRLIPLINSDAKTMVDLLTDMFSPESGSGGGGEGEVKTELVFGGEFDGLDLASIGQELRFAADERTNTLIAAGAEVYLRMVDEMVQWLDQQEADDRISQVYQAKYRDAAELASAVQGFIEQEQNVLGEADDETSRLRRQERQVSVESLGEEQSGSSQLIVGMSRRSYQKTMDMIRELDRPEPQVRISVLIAEVTLTDNLDLGVEIAGQDLRFTEQAVVGPNGTIQGGDFDFTLGTDLGAAGLGLGGFSFTLTGEDFSFLLRALQADSRVEVLSRPTLLVRNGQEGNITIADQVPYVESSQLNDTGSTNSTIGREDVGIVLTVTPYISPDGYVTIDMKQELSNLAGENLQLTEGVSSPIFQTREVQTNVTVRDSETVIIGGLITTRESEAENRVPFLGDLPGLGVLFRQNSVRKSRSELLIVLTVDILRTDDDRWQMSHDERGRYQLPPSILQSPLLEGLRIVPQNELGPQDGQRGQQPPHVPPVQRPRERQLYGPEPKTYGPIIDAPQPATTTTSTAKAEAVYGPTGPALAKKDEPSEAVE